MNAKKLAIAQGLRKYQGVPCKNGHDGMRYTINSDCVTCALERQNTEARKRYLTQYRAGAKRTAYQAQYNKIYEQSLLVKLKRSEYRKSNRAIGAERTQRYNASKMCRTPPWLTDDDLWMISEAYDLAAMRTKIFGFSWHVDHILPLRGKLVSGLHVPNNLQVIPGKDNMSKSNRFTVS